MDRFDVINFDDLTGPAGGKWIKIGGGSFGVVFKGEYLGTPVAIKEVLPNNTYDVEKYFERECVLMKEARHPNIVQYIGLTKSPGQDGRIYIISEFVGGNMRNYIADKSKPFPWRMRISFATDVARAVAYLHVRKCLHRDLKGENLLITANDRVKICDFGFARIAARNEDEMRRMSYCGTDGYMSPEILLGLDFSLPSDVFSLGVIFCEIAARHLVDATVFARQMPDFGLEESEIRDMASPGCPGDFIQLCIDCVNTDPLKRPDMREVVSRLRDIELEVTAQEETASKGTVKAVGSVRGSSLHVIMGGSKFSKRNQARAMPSFNCSDDTAANGSTATLTCSQHRGHGGGSSSEEEDLEIALAQLEGLRMTADPQDMLSHNGTMQDTFKPAGHGNPWWSDSSGSTQSSISNLYADWQTNMPEPTPPLASPAITFSSLLPSTTERSADVDLNATPTASVVGEQGDAVTDCMAASTLTVKEDSNDKKPVLEASIEEDISVPEEKSPASAPCSFISASSRFSNASGQEDAERGEAEANDGSDLESLAASSVYPPLHHRFTLIRNGTRRVTMSKAKEGFTTPSSPATSPLLPTSSAGLLPPALMLTQALARCHVCSKRIGWRPFLDCDDCPYRCHVACGEVAEPSCREIDMPQAAKDAQNKQSDVEGHDDGQNAEGVKKTPKKSHGAVCTGSNAPLLTVVNAERRVFNIDELNEVALIGQTLTKSGKDKTSGSGSEEEGRSAPPSPLRGSILAGAGGAAARLKRWSRGGSTAASAGAAGAAGRGVVKT
ncbi:kinase-like protein [Microstroma glucosiphilum]|uniref:Kinase-like protein n=1 Tax=Pseudomicrostroma glucosiphilum TaxID=1684307 RepID=A0A316U3L1_9BASI|nr:kinase-like protein [Pseudomicrostroma glucosiphilum]PWN19061.1 kinase-like protein [Pseudomicrostroma glucosiphilum]